MATNCKNCGGNSWKRTPGWKKCDFCGTEVKLKLKNPVVETKKPERRLSYNIYLTVAKRCCSIGPGQRCEVEFEEDVSSVKPGDNLLTPKFEGIKVVCIKDSNTLICIPFDYHCVISLCAGDKIYNEPLNIKSPGEYTLDVMKSLAKDHGGTIQYKKDNVFWHREFD